MKKQGTAGDATVPDKRTEREKARTLECGRTPEQTTVKTLGGRSAECVKNTAWTQDEISGRFDGHQRVLVSSVRLFDDRRFSGTISFTLPPGRSRPSDFFNSNDRFFSLRDDSVLHLFNKSYVAQVEGLEEEEAPLGTEAVVVGGSQNEVVPEEGIITFPRLNPYW